MKSLIIQNNSENKLRDLGYDFIRFIAMIFIILFHIVTTWNENNYKFPSVVNSIFWRNSINLGAVGVALFFMLSGALLISQYESRFSIKNFYVKRLLRIEIPQIICYTVAFLCQYTMTANIIHANISGILISLFGLDYSGDIWVKYLGFNSLGLVGEWFTFVIIFLYILFPIVRQLFITHLKLGTIIVSFLFIINLKFEILTRGGGWFSVSNALMCFWMGMLFEKYKQTICKNIVTIFLLPVAVLYWFINPYKIFGYPYLSCFIFSIVLFILFYQIKFSNKFTQYVCKYNFEIYLIHHRIYFWLLPAILSPASNFIQLVISACIVIGLTLLLAKSLNQISSYVLCKINLKR